MLKPPAMNDERGDERNFGDLVHQLIEDCKTYARAEADLAKAIAGEKAKGLRTAAILLVLALFVAMGALNALCVGILLGFGALMSPVLAGLCSFLVIGAVAGVLAWVGIKKLGDSL
jgi:hypothetical protein